MKQVDVDLSEGEDPMPRMIHIDAAAFALDAQTMSNTELAAKYQCSAAVISRRKHEFGIAGRRRDPATPPAAVVGNRRDNGLITLQVSEAVLDHIWKSLPAKTKGDLLNGFQEIVEE